MQYQIVLSTSVCICWSTFMARLSHVYRSFCHALSLSLADSHGKATIQVKILLCLSDYKIIVTFRAGSKSLPEGGSYLWVSSLELLPLEKAAKGRSGMDDRGCAVELCLLCSLGTVVVTKGSALPKLHRQEQPRGKFPWSNTNAKPLFPSPHP